jgi:FkbM family methyltransferase
MQKKDFKNYLLHLPSWMKQILRVLLVIPTRLYIRYFPWPLGKRLLWQLVASHVWWLETIVWVRTKTGDILFVDAADILGRYIYYFGVWEPTLTRWLISTLKPGDGFIDIGANIGYLSLLAAKLVGGNGRVLAIEALPKTARVLEMNVQMNGGENIRIANNAAWDRKAVLRFFTQSEHITGTTTCDKSWADSWGLDTSCEVNAMPLGNIASSEETAMARIIKIDVEGAEWNVVSGLAAVLPLLREDVEFVVEVNFKLLRDQGKSADVLLAVFKIWGFNAYCLPNDYAAETYMTEGDEPKLKRLRNCTNLSGVQADMVFSRRDADVL